MSDKHEFRFTVVGRYTSPVMGNEPAVTVNLVAGRGEHMSYCGTLTMAESDWDILIGALRYSLKDSVQLHDPRHMLEQ